MITKCPNCSTKFNVREEYKGRNTKCPKCEQPFTIGEFIGKPAPSIGKDVPSAHEVGLCFFCRGNADKEESVYMADMYIILNKVKPERKWDPLKFDGQPFRGGFTSCFFPDKRIPYTTRQERIPRCETCKQCHGRIDKRQQKWMTMGCVSGIVIALGLLVCYVVASFSGKTTLEEGAVFAFLMLGCVLAALGWFVGLFLGSLLKPRLPDDVLPLTEERNFPRVKERLSHGWKLGRPVDLGNEVYVERKVADKYLHLFRS